MDAHVHGEGNPPGMVLAEHSQHCTCIRLDTIYCMIYIKDIITIIMNAQLRLLGLPPVTFHKVTVTLKRSLVICTGLYHNHITGVA